MIEFVVRNKDKFEKVLKSTSHAILLESTDTVLSSTLAKVFAMNLFCVGENTPCLMCSNCLKIMSSNSLDTLIYPKNSTLLMDDVNEILDNLNITPAENDYKVFVINGIDEANALVQNKLLKSIEEPPKFVKFILTCKNKLRVIPTIVSRCETIALPKFEPDAIKPLVDNLPSDIRQIIAENCNGNITLLEKLKSENNFVENYNFALNLLKNLQSSKDLLTFSCKLSNSKQNFLEIIDLIDVFLQDIVKINENCNSLVQNKYCLETLKKISANFSTKACLNISEHILLVKEKIKMNGNLGLITDEWLLKILEEKWQNKK